MSSAFQLKFPGFDTRNDPCSFEADAKLPTPRSITKNNSVAVFENWNNKMRVKLNEKNNNSKKRFNVFYRGRTSP